MHLTLIPPPLAALDGQIMGLLFMAAAMCFAATIAITAFYFKHQRQKLWHDTARIALEKGQPVPPMSPQRSHDRPPVSGNDLNRHDLRAGLILVGVGFGIYLFFNAVGGSKVGYLGAIPGFIGVALLLHRLFTALAAPKKPDPAQAPK